MHMGRYDCPVSDWLLPPLVLWFSAVSIVGMGFLKRDDPKWRAAAPQLAIMALFQVFLGVVVAIVTMPALWGE